MGQGKPRTPQRDLSRGHEAKKSGEKGRRRVRNCMKTELPAEEGWYWYAPTEDYDPMPVYVDLEGNFQGIDIDGDVISSHIDNGGLWSEPINP
jgi:hypothetical protein